MEVHPLGPDAWAALRDLRLQALTSDPEAFGETLEDAAAVDEAGWRRRAEPVDGVVMVADADGTLVGMAVVEPAPIVARGVAAVGAMWVAPEIRGRGVGGRLLEAVGDWATAAGYGAIGLGVTPDNVAAITIYERHGYVDTGIRVPIRDGSDDLVQIMTKSLIEGFAPTADEMVSGATVRSAPLPGRSPASDRP